MLDRLREAGCIREDGKDILIAANDRLVQYETYLDLKRRYQTNDRVPVEAQAVSVSMAAAYESIAASRTSLSTAAEAPGAGSRKVTAAASTMPKQIDLMKSFSVAATP